MVEERKHEPRLVIAIPCYNEEQLLPVSGPVFLRELELLIEKKKISSDSRILFVDNNSEDHTWQIIENFARENKHFYGISQSKNRGYQSNVLAGLMEAKKIADIVITIDSDGQDDIAAMEQMVDEYQKGADVVCGVRSNRDVDPWLKRTMSQGFYRFLHFMGVETIYNHGDYRLVSARVLQHFSDFHEVNLYLRGLFPLIGFKSTCVYYERHERMAGGTHFSFSSLAAIAIDGITNLSIRPITLIAELGAIISGLSFIGILFAFVNAIFVKDLTPGWPSLICIICFLGGIQMLSLGIIGVYVGKTYLEAKHRPRYIISERTDDQQEKSTYQEG